MAAVETSPTPDSEAPLGDRARRIPWGRLGLEVAVIVFSVLLALVLDDWRQARDESELVEMASVSLLIELETNQRLPHEPHDRSFMLSTVYTVQDDLSRSGLRLLDKVDRYRLARYGDGRLLGVAADLRAGLDGVLRAEEALCDWYRKLAANLTGRRPSDENRCGSGNVGISQSGHRFPTIGLEPPRLARLSSLHGRTRLPEGDRATGAVEPAGRTAAGRAAGAGRRQARRGGGRPWSAG